jgi:hypothetical protein
MSEPSNGDARRRRWWIRAAALAVLVAGMAIAIWFPTKTVVREHVQCQPDPCISVVGPVTTTYAALRLGIAGLSVLPVFVLMLVALARQPGHRRLYITAGLVLFLAAAFAVFAAMAGGPAVSVILVTVGGLVAVILFLFGTHAENQHRGT